MEILRFNSPYLYHKKVRMARKIRMNQRTHHAIGRQAAQKAERPLSHPPFFHNQTNILHGVERRRSIARLMRESARRIILFSMS